LEWFQAVILGIVQGIGEFLPISSSAHLVLVPWFMGWPWFGLTFDVALHVGTLFAVVAFFWRDWFVLAADGLRGRRTTHGRLFWYLVVATVPGALFGYMLEGYAETIFREPLVIATMLILMGIILWLVDSKAKNLKAIEQISLRDSLFIGVSQAFAIIPGVSRAGVTMTAGRFLNLDRETSARFSFLLSTPIIFGAGVSQLPNMSPGEIDAGFILGVITSAVVGFLSIKFLLRYLTRRSFMIFVWYRLVLGLLVIGIAITR